MDINGWLFLANIFKTTFAYLYNICHKKGNQTVLYFINIHLGIRENELSKLKFAFRTGVIYSAFLNRIYGHTVYKTREG